MIRLARSLPLALLTLLSPAIALAHGTSKDALAESLFQDAKKLLAAGKTAAACEKFKASLDVDHASGTLTALAFCHQKEGRTASAWAEYLEVANEAKRTGKSDQERYAREQIALLEKVLRRVVLTATATPGLQIAIDGVVLPTSALGTPIPVDPGPRTFEASAPGHATGTVKQELEAGPGTTEIALVLGPEAAPRPTAAPAKPSPEPPRTAPLPLAVAGGIMIAGAALASFGAYAQVVVARGDQERSETLARQALDLPASRDAHDRAVTWSAIGVTSLVVGGAAVLFGGYLGYRSLTVVPYASRESAGIALGARL